MCHVFTFQPDDFSLIMVSNLLGIEKTQLQKWLCNRKLVATGEVYIKPLTIQEVSQMSNSTYSSDHKRIFRNRMLKLKEWPLFYLQSFLANLKSWFEPEFSSNAWKRFVFHSVVFADTLSMHCVHIRHLKLYESKIQHLLFIERMNEISMSAKTFLWIKIIILLLLVNHFEKCFDRQI